MNKIINAIALAIGLIITPLASASVSFHLGACSAEASQLGEAVTEIWKPANVTDEDTASVNLCLRASSEWKTNGYKVIQYQKGEDNTGETVSVINGTGGDLYVAQGNYSVSYQPTMSKWAIVVTNQAGDNELARVEYNGNEEPPPSALFDALLDSKYDEADRLVKIATPALLNYQRKIEPNSTISTLSMAIWKPADPTEASRRWAIFEAMLNKDGLECKGVGNYDPLQYFERHHPERDTPVKLDKICSAEGSASDAPLCAIDDTEDCIVAEQEMSSQPQSVNGIGKFHGLSFPLQLATGLSYRFGFTCQAKNDNRCERVIPEGSLKETPFIQCGRWEMDDEISSIEAGATEWDGHNPEKEVQPRYIGCAAFATAPFTLRAITTRQANP